MLEHRYESPNHLSGGQKQKIAIAGILALKSKCIVLDEPTAMLDPRGRKEVIETIKWLTTFIKKYESGEKCKGLYLTGNFGCGKTYLVVKTLITGSVRGQSLTETLKFMERNVLNKNNCYLPETIPLCEEMNRYTNSFFEGLTEGIK